MSNTAWGAHGKQQDEPDEPEFTPLTAEQAKALREQQPSFSPWAVVAGQAGVGFLVALLAWGLTGQSNRAWSAAYGAVVVIIPAALFAWGLMDRFSALNRAGGGAGFFVLEAVKILASVGLLFAATQVVANLDWLALLAGLVVTMKVYWVALWLRPKRKTD